MKNTPKNHAIEGYHLPMDKYEPTECTLKNKLEKWDDKTEKVTTFLRWEEAEKLVKDTLHEHFKVSMHFSIEDRMKDPENWHLLPDIIIEIYNKIQDKRLEAQDNVPEEVNDE